LPAICVSRKVARDIFQGTNKNLDYILRDLGQNPQSFATGKIVVLVTQFLKIEPGVGENVVGIIPGQDRDLKHETIVVGAHMDHNGRSPNGQIYRGADDNASGTALIMELARTLVNYPGGLKRTIVFIGFGGEEQGLLGSRYFALHPTVPAENICAMFNFDMVGTGSGGGGFGGRNYFPELVNHVFQKLEDSDRKKLTLSRGWGMGGSDHAHFIEQGIPAFGFYSTGGHPFYHRLEDTPTTINLPSIQFVGERAMECLLALANAPFSLLYNGAARGRCFLLFGDQIDFDGDFLPLDQLGEKSEWILKQAHAQGIRGVILPVTDSDDFTTDPFSLYRAVDRFSQWIKDHQKSFIRFVNGSSLNTAASRNKVALLLALRDTRIIKEDPAHFRNLVKMGVNVLTLADTTDPVFNHKNWSDFGQQILNACKEENVLIEWRISDPHRILVFGKSYEGRSILRLDMHQIQELGEKLKSIPLDEQLLLVVECCPRTTVTDCIQILESVGSKYIHFSLIGETCSECQDETEEVHPSHLWAFRLVQALYQKRLEKYDKKAVYDEMVCILGGNLKRTLQ
jgi:hypothetical protein